MFGMGFTEIIIIAIIAVIFLGPDKLPETMINIAKFFRSIKSTVANAKDTFEQELNVSELKREALSYKEDLMSASNELSRVTSMANLDNEFDEVVHSVETAKDSVLKSSSESTPASSAAAEAVEKKVTFEKKKKEDNA